MAFRHLPDFCPEIAKEQTWCFTLPVDQNGLKAGDYVFLESYCDEAGCDCRRVWLTVLHRKPGAKTGDLIGPLATIGFGWEKPEFYKAWSPGDPDACKLAGARLEPFQPQDAKADKVLAMTIGVILRPPANVQRLKDHYAAVRKAVEGPDAGGGPGRGKLSVQ